MSAEETKKPTLVESSVLSLIGANYDIGHIERLIALPSYDDQNFRVCTNQNEFVFKITSMKQDFMEAVDHVTSTIEAHSNTKGIVTTMIKNKDNNAIFPHTDSTGTYRCTMVHYIKGKTARDALSQEKGKEERKRLYQTIGENLAHMDRILSRECDHKSAHRNMEFWDLGNFMDNLPLVGDVVGEDYQNLVQKVFEDYQKVFLPRKKEFRSSIIHCDANLGNIIVNRTGTLWHVSFIDFLDMVYTCTVFNIAIGMAYMMRDRENPLELGNILLGAYHAIHPLSDEEIDVLPVLIRARLATSVIQCAQKRLKEPENEYAFTDEDAGWHLLKFFSTIGDENAKMIFRSVCHKQFSLPDLYREKEVIMAMRNEFLSANLSVAYSPEPLTIVRGFMQYLYDNEGREYIDGINNVCHVGHCHPKVVRYAQQQMAMLNTNTRYLHDYLVSYAKRLSSTFPEPLSVCFLVCSGSEANELALRLARCHTKRKGILVMDHGYHGNTESLVSLSSYKCEGRGGEGLAPFARKAPFPDLYRGDYGDSNLEVGPAYAKLAEKEIEELQEKGGGLAAFIAESILGCAGQVVLPDGYFSSMYQRVRKSGGVCIADEVQTGFGRCGKAMWAFETQQVVPDIVTLGKPIGNGHPIGAVITTPKIARSFHNGMEYFNTFGGNPVSCAIGMAVLDVIEEEKLMEHARTEGDFLLDRFNNLKDRFECIGDVRGMGLYLGIEIVKDKLSKLPDAATATKIVQGLKKSRILLSTDGPYHNVLKMKPPMVFGRKDSITLLAALEEQLSLL